MKNLILPILLSLTLIACGSGSADSAGGGDAPTADNNTPDPSTTPTPDPTCATDVSVCGLTMDNGFSFTESLGAIIVADTAPSATDPQPDSFPSADTVILPAIAVLFNDSTAYTRGNASLPWMVDDDDNTSTPDILNPTGLTITRTATLSRTDILGDSPTLIPTPTIQLTFDGTNPIAAVINADEPYSDVTADLQTVFGFTNASNYMAFVKWEYSPAFDLNAETGDSATDYSKQGMAIAGIATTDFTTLNGGAQFTGKGEGIYGVFQADKSFTTYNTIFDIIVNADFTDKTVDFHSTGTVACTGCTALPTGVNLDVTAVDLSFDNVGNNTSGAASAGLLTGTLDARFYGTDTDSGKEFGGTFALKDTANYYYGAFGAEVGDWSVMSNNVTTLAEIPNSAVPAMPYNTPTADEASKQGLTSFADTDANKGKTNIILPASIVTIQRSTTANTITNNSINDAVLDFSYDATGQFVASETNPTALYFGDKRYAVLASLELSQDTIKNGDPNVDTSDGASINAFIINKTDSRDSFGFAAEYMVNISWAALNNTAGAGIAGFETATPLTAGTTRFNGRGIGYYTDTMFPPTNGIRYFDMVADIDFGNYTVALASSNTCTSSVAADCVAGQNSPLKPEHDFEGNLTYKAGTNALTFTNLVTRGTDGSFTATDGKELTGTADAKFYGANSGELGGTFSLQNGSGEGYIGFFGAQRGYVITPKAAEAIATSNLPTETDNVAGLTGFQDPTRGTTGKENNYLNIDNLVRIKKDSSTKTITLDEVTGAVAYFEYASDGNYATNADASAAGLQLYIDDKKYISGAHTGDGAAISADGDATGGGDGVTINDLQLDSDNGNTGVFGNINYYYLALVSWGETHNDYNRFGYGITGYETATTGNNALLTTGANIFKGAGRGRYQQSSGTSNINTRFNIEAEVDFATRMVSLKSTGTCDSDSMNCKTSIAHLNFMTDAVTYAAGTNALKFANVTTDGYVDVGDVTNNIASLSGDLSAKFYGPLTSELGGTFSFQNDIAGYIGYFGAERDYIVNATIASTTTDATITNHNAAPVTEITVPTTFTTLTGFNDPLRNGTVGNALPMELVQITTNSQNKTISSDRFTGGVAEFSYNAAGNWQSMGGNDAVVVYFADKIYSIIFGNSTPYYLSEVRDRLGTSNDVGPSNMEFRRDYFGFNAAYMASIRYILDETFYGSYAYGITGFETTRNGGSSIKTTGTTIFTGKGRGYANDNSNDKNQFYFDIDAEIDFATRMVSLQSKNSCTNKNNCENTQRPDYNFSGELIYADGVNALTGTLTTDGDENHAPLTGNATAKFYGPQSDELGGTFALSNANANYVGYFGAERGLIVLPTESRGTDAMIGTETLPTEDRKSLTGFNDSSRAGVTGVTLNVASIVQITKNADADKETILNEKISGGVTRFDYDAETDSNQPNYEHFADAGLTLYFADKKYESTSGDGDENSIRSSVTNTDGDVPDFFDFGISDASFGFLPKYMARFYWEIYQNKTYGFGITGFETAGADIPTTGTGIMFSGEGQGQYHDKDSSVSSGGDIRYFTITATADFTMRKVTLQSSHTCSSTLSASSTCAHTNSQKNHLNFKGELSYGVTTGGTPTAINEVTGTIKTAGDNMDFAIDDGTEMNGSANARFYGTGTDVATEFGGTFNLTGADSGYVGYFGAR